MDRAKLVRELLNSHKTFYTKRYQSNGYYPIDKYEWHDDEQAYFIIPFKVKNPYLYGPTLSALEYILLNNSFLISTEEFMDTNSYNNENKQVI